MITGGAGFIGFHLAQRLADRGDSVLILDDLSRGVMDRDLEELLSGGTEMVSVDLGRELESTFNPDVIVHLAAIVGVERVNRNPYGVLEGNVGMLARLLDYARTATNLRNLIFASTSEVYGQAVSHGWAKLPTPEGTPFVLSDASSSRSSYALSKIFGESMCHASRLPVTVVRPHNVYGPRMGRSHVIPQLLEKAWRASPGEALPVASPNHTRTFCFVDDATEYLERLVDLPGSGLVLNLGVDTPEIRIRDLGVKIQHLVGNDGGVLALEDTPGSPPRRVPDTSRLIEVTDYLPRVSLDSGLDRTFRWYRDEVFSGKTKSSE